MPGPRISLSRKGSGSQDLYQRLRSVLDSEVLVGIPAEKTVRTEDQPGDGMNNATLLFIQSEGSPLNGIPARPVVQIGIENAKTLISRELAESAQAVIHKQPTVALTHLNRAGALATNAAKRVFGSDQLEPNKPSTIRAKAKPGTEGTNNPLIDSGQLRRALTYVVKPGK